MYLFVKYVMVMAFFSFLVSSLAFGQTTLMHSYTFEDGTADDGTGSADGVLQGDALISDGAVTLSGTGFVSLPGKEINIPAYGSITVEAVFKQAPGLGAGFTVLYAFGETNPAVDWMGIDYFLYQPTRQDNEFSRFSISCDDTDSPWSSETGINAKEIVDTSMHYVVTVLTATEMKLYLDGALLGTETLADKNKIVNLSADTAYIGASVYPNDDKWQGSVYLMNIYEGEMDEVTVVSRAEELLGVPVTDATLSDIKANKGELSPEFDTGTDLYELNVEYGTSQVVLEATTTVLGAKVEMFDGLDNEIFDGIVNFTGDGIDVKIVVTALNGTTQETYFVSIFLFPKEETASLVDIALSAGSFIQEFNMDSLYYTAIVPYGTTSVRVTGIPAWSGAIIVGGGTIDLTDGLGSTSITVISEDGMNVKVYTVDIGATKVATGNHYYIVHEASSLVIGDVSKQPQLANPVYNDSTQLFEFVPSGVDDQFFIQNMVPRYLSSRAGSSWDMIMVDELTNDLDSCRFILHEFEIGRFRIETVIKDGADRRFMGTNWTTAGEWVFNDKFEDEEYAIWNILPPEEVVDPYDTYLSDLSIDQGSLSPSFDMYKQDYYVTLPIGTASLTVSATANDAGSTISGTGVIDVSGGPGETTVTVTASDPSYTRDYVIHYQEDTPLTLMHSYTFEDGTAQDQAGTADGIVDGGDITGGIYTASVEGDDYITLPPEELALYTYPSITMEAYVLTGENPGWTMFAYFGGLQGANVHFLSLAGQTDLSRTVINEGAGESAAGGTEPGAGELHHYVSILTNDTIAWYIDGTLAAKTEINPAYTIHGISTENAWLCKSGYSADPTWIGSIYEFNIYSGQMDADTIAQRAYNWPLEDSTSTATLSDIAVDGETIENFSPLTLNYTVVLSNDITNVPTVTATPSNSAASLEITPATALPGYTTVMVTAEDGFTTNTYSILFKNVGSNDATLSDLTIDGATVEGFDPGKSGYVMIMSEGASVVPTVVATANDPNASVEVNPATSVPGTTTVVVTAEDGVTIKNYVVAFYIPSSVDNLKETSITVYPTIFDNSFTVKSSGGILRIAVYDINGKLMLIRDNVFDETEISISKSGMYIVKVEGNGVVETFKVFKVK